MMQLPAHEISRRKATVEKFQKCLHKCHEDVKKVLDQLGWSSEHLINKASSPVACLHDPGHVISKKSLVHHAPVCQLVKKGLSREDAEDVVASSDMFSERQGAVRIDQTTLNGILSQHYLQNHGTGYVKGVSLPVTPEDAAISLSRDERLAVHDYVVQKVCDQKWDTQGDLSLIGLESTDKDAKSSGPMSLLEQMAASRDYKRRRQSYRAKNVHTSKKSYTEIIRELISNQMEIFPSSAEDNKDHKTQIDPVVKTEPKGSDSEQSSTKYQDSLGRESPGDRHKRRKHHKHKHVKHKRHKSERRGDSSERRGDNSERRGDNSERRGDSSERRGDSSERREDNSERREDSSERRGDHSERREKRMSRKEYRSDRKRDRSERKEGMSERREGRSERKEHRTFEEN